MGLSCEVRCLLLLRLLPLMRHAGNGTREIVVLSARKGGGRGKSVSFVRSLARSPSLDSRLDRPGFILIGG